MRVLTIGLSVILWINFPVFAQLETRLHSFEYASPDLVEKQLRSLIPEGPRVSMNPGAKQVIVIADAETHEKIASMLKELGRPPSELKFVIRHNREMLIFTVASGIPFTLPVTQTPPAQLIEMARSRLDPEKRRLPVVGSALQVHALLLREDPAMARMRVTPAVLFGMAQPYEVIDFPRLSMDLMLDTESYIELQESLTRHDFYRLFLKTQTDSQSALRPVSLLVSFEGLKFKTPEAEPNEN